MRDEFENDGKGKKKRKKQKSLLYLGINGFDFDKLTKYTAVSQ